MNKQAKLNQEFVNSICLKFKLECERLSIEQTNENLIKYIMQHNVVPIKQANRYMVQQLYPKAMYESNGVKKDALFWLEEETGLGERSCWNIINNYGFVRFKKRKIDFE